MNNSIINAQKSRGFLNMHPTGVRGLIYIWGWMALLMVGATPAMASAVPGGSCKLNKPAKLYVSKDGKPFSSKLKVGAVVKLKHEDGARWMVETEAGKLGFLDSSWMSKVCAFRAPVATSSSSSTREAPALDAAALQETAAALEVSKDVAEGRAKLDASTLAEQTAKISMARAARTQANASECVDRSESLRVAVYDLERLNVPDGIGKASSSAVLAEIRKLEGISAIGMDEIREMLDFEAQRQALGCDADDQCLAEIAGALGVDEIITGRLSEEADGRTLLLRRIDQRRAEIVGTFNQRLKVGNGEEFLLAIGPGIEKLFPERKNRPGTTRGVAKRALLRLNPPPIAPSLTLSTIGGAVAALAAGGVFAYMGQEKVDFYNSGAGLNPGVLSTAESRIFDDARTTGERYLLMRDVGLIAGGTMALGSAIMSLFTDWQGWGDEETSED